MATDDLCKAGVLIVNPGESDEAISVISVSVKTGQGLENLNQHLQTLKTPKRSYFNTAIPWLISCTEQLKVSTISRLYGISRIGITMSSSLVNCTLVSISSVLFKLFSTVLLAISMVACSGGGNNGLNSSSGSPWVVNGYHLVATGTYDESNSINNSTTYEYDLDLNKVVHVRGGFDYVTGFSNDVTYRYNDQGNIIESQSGDEIYSFDSFAYIDKYVFNERGLLVAHELGTKDNGVFNSIGNAEEFEYNSAGDLIRHLFWEVIGDDSEPPTIETIEYDGNGYRKSASQVRRCRYPDTAQDENCTVRTTSYAHNHLGQLVRKEVSYDSIESSFESYSETYAYDRHGNMIESNYTSTYDTWRTVYVYAENLEPVYNHWIRMFKFYP